MYDHILLPIGDSSTTSATIEHAVTFTRTYSAAVRVLSVTDSRNRFESPSADTAPDVWEKSESDRAKPVVDIVIETFPEGAEIERIAMEDVPHLTIVDYAVDGGIDLAVTVTRGHTGLGHYLVGSVTERVVRQLDAPVLIVRVVDEE